MAVRKWSNVAVAMQSALGAAITISAISKAAPGIVNAAGHGLANGAYVMLEIQGMYQLNGRVFRVANVAAETFELEDVTGGTGIDTTDFDAFTSGTVKEITFGTSITTATTVNSSGGDFDFIDTTTIHVNQKSQIPGSANPISYAMEQLWDVSDAGQIAMKTASDTQDQRAFRFTFGTGGPIMVFVGFVGFSGSPGGTAQDKITTPATITAFGSPTYYSA
ncbi:MAG: phage tail protein [Methylomicrobium sp.]|nr:phage tail protein [Methylomicrobium sp.]